MNFNERMTAEVTGVNEIVCSYLPPGEGYASLVKEAASYSVRAGGKRLRPLLMRECYRLFGGTDELVNPYMAAIEYIHTYSLVHDDLPCMDNDMYRRGKLTTHAVYGEGMGVLAGDALLNLAFEVVARAIVSVSESACGETAGKEELWESTGRLSRCARALAVLADKAGMNGMIGGQCADLAAEGLGAQEAEDGLLLYIHEHKTAAMIQSAMMVGAILAGASDSQVRLLEQAGWDIGMAFQIQDDILDVTGSTEELGKETGSDNKNEKMTYVSVHGLEDSEREAERLSAHALEILVSLRRSCPGVPRDEVSFLEQIVKHLVGRKR